MFDGAIRDRLEGLSQRFILRSKRVFSLDSWLLSLYLGLAPVYFIPGIDPWVLRWIKGTLFILAVSLVLFPAIATGRLRLPRGLLGILGFAGLVLFSIPGWVQASTLFHSLEHLIDIVLAALFLWSFYHIASHGGDVVVIFRRAFLIVGGLAGIAIVKMFLEVPDWTSPFEMAQEVATEVGLSYRNSWSNSLALYLPGVVLLAASGRSGRGRIRWTTLGLLLVTLILGSQLLSGGRGGILASAIAALLMLLTPGLRAMGVMVLIVGIALGTFCISDSQCTGHLRLNGLKNAIVALLPSTPVPSESFSTDLDNLSSHRTSGYASGLKWVMERPIRGHGIMQRLVVGNEGRLIEIHSLWLKWAVYFGILAPTWLLAIVMFLLLAALRAMRGETTTANHRNVPAPMGIVVILGALISLVEPSALLGAFQYTSVWWAAAGSLAGIEARSRSGEP